MNAGETPEKNDVLDADEASAWLKIPKSTLYKLCTEGEVPAAKVGRHWRFHRETLESWLLDRTKARGRDDMCDE
jgi:excisionase family DNA binding protein